MSTEQRVSALEVKTENHEVWIQGKGEKMWSWYQQNKGRISANTKYFELFIALINSGMLIYLLNKIGG
jgi:hypothetical protein